MINVNSLHITKLGEKRIKCNLGITGDAVSYCKQIVRSADRITKKGKNYYVSNKNYVLTINIRSNTIITAHKIKYNS